MFVIFWDLLNILLTSWPENKICSFSKLEMITSGSTLNILILRQIDRHFVNDYLKCIFLNGKVWNFIKNYIFEGQIDNKPA